MNDKELTELFEALPKEQKQAVIDYLSRLDLSYNQQEPVSAPETSSATT